MVGVKNSQLPKHKILGGKVHKTCWIGACGGGGGWDWVSSVVLIIHYADDCGEGIWMGGGGGRGE